MQKSTKNNKYKYDIGSVAFVVTDRKNIIEIIVEKRLKRPYRLSDNFYYCSWNNNGKNITGIKYEAEMFPDYESALFNAINTSHQKNIFDF